MIRNAMFRAYILIAEFSGKILDSFCKNHICFVKFTGAWCNTMEIFKLTAICKL